MIKQTVEEFQPYNDALINSPLGKELKVRDVDTTAIIPGQVPSSKSDLAKDKVGDPRYVDANKLPYMRLVVCLLYVMTCTRPDISFPTAVISRFVL